MYGLSVLQYPLIGDCAKPTRVVDRLQKIQPFDTAVGNLVSDPLLYVTAQRQPLFMQAEQLTVDRTALMKFAKLCTNRIRRQKTRLTKKDFQHLPLSHGDMQVCNHPVIGHIAVFW